MFVNIPLLKTINNENKNRHNPALVKHKVNYYFLAQQELQLFFSKTEKHKGNTPSPVKIKALVSIPFFSMYRLAAKTITPLIVLLLLHLPLESAKSSLTAFSNSAIGLTPPFISA